MPANIGPIATSERAGWVVSRPITDALLVALPKLCDRPRIAGQQRCTGRAERDHSAMKSVQSVKRCKMSVIFCPPKPKLFESATSTVFSRAA